MKKNLLRMVAAALMFCCAANVQAAGDEKNGHAYFTKAELPDMTKILPPYPEFESARFVADQSQHLWGKLMRQDEARAAQAQRDAVYSMQTVIAGYHWQSDVDAGRMTGSVLYQLIRNHKRFIEQLAKARAEFAEKTGDTTRIAEAPRAQQQNSSARVYRLDGIPADNSSHGILIQNNQKFIRK